MPPQNDPFFRSQTAGFEQDRVGYTEFPDIVHESAASDVGDLFITQTGCARQLHCQLGDSLRVPFRLPATQSSACAHPRIVASYASTS